MGNLHSLWLTSRTRSKDNVVVIIALDWMCDLIASPLGKGFLNLIQSHHRCRNLHQWKSEMAIIKLGSATSKIAETLSKAEWLSMGNCRHDLT